MIVVPLSPVILRCKVSNLHYANHCWNRTVSVTASKFAPECRPYSAPSKKDGADEKIDSFPPNQLSAFVSCLPGLERILSSELLSQGVRHDIVSQGVKLRRPTMESLFSMSLRLGTASNILLRCGPPFSARGLPELRRKTARLPWDQMLSPNVRIEARVKTSKSKLYHSSAIQARVIAGVYEALGHEIPQDRHSVVYPPGVDMEDAPVVRLDIRIENDQVSIFMFATPTPLHRRGYRLQTSKAPLREDLAFAMLHGAGWTRDTGYYESLLDPFCGSGTIAIEAAAIRAGLPPGRLRPAPFAGTTLQNDQLWEDLVRNSIAESRSDMGRCVAASDRDSGAVQATTSNATRAGVQDWIDIQQSSLSANLHWSDSASESQTSLLVVTNPPFGKRISSTKGHGGKKEAPFDTRKLLPLYQTLQGQAERHGQARVVMLTHSPDLVRRAGWHFNPLFKSTLGGTAVTAVVSEQECD